MPDHHNDLLLVDGSPVLGVVPGGMLLTCPNPLPIYLFRGNAGWGYNHIVANHGRNRLFLNAPTIEDVILSRCCQEGVIQKAFGDGKVSISIELAPSAFMVLIHKPEFNCYSMTTMYSKRKPSTEEVLGQYVGRAQPAARPIFAWVSPA